MKLANIEQTVILWRENQRISLRAFLRSLLSNPQIAQTKAMLDFLVDDPVTLKDDDVVDIQRRKSMDEKRVEEQRQFYEVARKRAAELDVYMEELVLDTQNLSPNADFPAFAETLLRVMVSPNCSRKSRTNLAYKISAFNTRSSRNGYESRWLRQSIISSWLRTTPPNCLRKQRRSTR